MLDKEVLKTVSRIELSVRGTLDTVMTGAYHSSFKGNGMEFSEVREYMPGDDVRTIDWNVTARTGTPYVKKYIEEREMTMLLMVDASSSSEFGSGKQMKGEVMATLTALLAFAAIKNNDKVGLLIYTDRSNCSSRRRKAASTCCALSAKFFTSSRSTTAPIRRWRWSMPARF